MWRFEVSKCRRTDMFSPLVDRKFMIQPEELVGDEWAAWYRLSPVERWRESEQLWQFYSLFGGSLDTQRDTQSLFSIRTHRVRPLLMGGQACVFYGAAEFSRETDLAIFASSENLARLTRA